MHNYSSLLESIWNHPANIRTGRAKAFAKFAGWQATKRLVKKPVISSLPGGKRIVLYPDSHLPGEIIYYGGFRDVDEIEFIRRYLRSGDTAIDVGANEGMYTLPMSDLVGKTGKVFAIEPLPTNIERLRANLALNRVTNVDVIECAASDKNGFVEFTLDRAAGSSSEHILNSADHGVETFTVETVRIDALDHGGAVQFLKLDVEGVEPLVLRGTTSLLAQHAIPVVLMEFVDKFMMRYGLSADSTVDWLESLGYRIGHYASASNTISLGGKELASAHTNVLVFSSQRLAEVVGRVKCDVVDSSTK